jgi:uncharacterized caspase-like protein
MDHKLVPDQHTKAPPVDLLGRGRVVAVVVGLEQYQPRRKGETVTSVDFARNDAEAFAQALESIYPADRLSLTLLRDSAATYASLSDDLRYAIKSLAPDDLFIFYYAGHGFHGAGGNRLTTWDTNPFNIEGTTLLVREVLTDQLAASPCQRALVFIDACASGFTVLGQARDLLASMNPQELREFLGAATYSAMFLSCKPGEKSYPSNTLQHGVWTYFLLKALKGEAEEALGPERYLTDTALRDYLCSEVSRYITREMEVRGNQTPQAVIDASNTFAIRQVPARPPALPAGDLSKVRAPILGEYFERVRTEPISSLDGFDKRRGHFVPKVVTLATTKFVLGLLSPGIDEEIQQLYEATKAAFKLKRSDVPHSSGDGQGSIDTEFFRFSIDARQDDGDPANYVIVKRLELRDAPDGHIEKIDEVFGSMFDEIVVDVEARALDFDQLVDLFEDIAKEHGGELKDEQRVSELIYTAVNGTRITINTARGRITLGTPGRQSCSILLERARQYRFGLTGQSRLMLT